MVNDESILYMAYMAQFKLIINQLLFYDKINKANIITGYSDLARAKSNNIVEEQEPYKSVT